MLLTDNNNTTNSIQKIIIYSLNTLGLKVHHL